MAHSRFLFLLAISAYGQGIITTIAGTDWIFPSQSLPALSAPLSGNQSLAVALNGDLLIGDCDNSAIFRIDSAGTLSLIAGNGIRGAGPDGPARGTGLYCPQSLVPRDNGEIFFADGHLIRKLTPAGQIVTLGGRAQNLGEGIPAISARMNPSAIVMDAPGNIIYSEVSTHRIRRISPDGIVRTVAGTGEVGFSGDGGPALNARFNRPASLTLLPSGQLLIADTENLRVRSLDAAGIVRTVAGSGTKGDTVEGIPAVSASFYSIRSLLAEPDDGFLLTSNSWVFRVDPSGRVSRFAGTNESYSGDGGPARSAGLGAPDSLARGSSGVLYLSDAVFARTRAISPQNIVSTVAGNGLNRATPDAAPPRSAWLNKPNFLAISPAGLLTIGDQHNGSSLRQLGADGLLRRLFGGVAATTNPASALTTRAPISGLAFDKNSNIVLASGSMVLRITPDGAVEQLFRPGLSPFRVLFGLAINPAGEIIVADYVDNRIRKIGLSGEVSTLAGTGDTGFSGDGGPAAAARLSQPLGVVTDAAGNVYFSDSLNHRVRRISTSGVITTIAGDGQGRSRGDGGPATEASIFLPAGLAFDNEGNLLIAEISGNRVRMLRRDGTISTIAGNGQATFSGDGGSPLNASIQNPTAVAVDPTGRIYIADTSNDRVRVILPTAPSFSLSSSQINLSDSAQVQLNSSIPGLAFTATAPPTAPWLTLTPTSGSLPAALSLSANTANLAPGRYSASVTVNVPLATPATRQLTVNLTVDPPPASGRLTAGSQSLAFTFQPGALPSSVSLSLAHSGSAAIDYRATVRGATWLSATPAQGQLIPRNTTTLQLTATPGALPPATYSATLDITAGAETLSIPVTMSISRPGGRLLLSQTGLTFLAVQGGGAPARQQIGVLNEGSGSLEFTATAIPLQGGAWLRLANAQGRIERPLEEVKFVDIAVNHSGLAAGDYYAELRFTAPGATPQIATILLKVLPAGSDPGPEISPSGLVFIGTPDSPPGSQDLFLSNLRATTAAYTSSSLTFNGARWLNHAPATASLVPGDPRRVVVEPNFAGLAPGIHRAVVYFLFEDGTSRSANVLSIIPASVTPSNKSGDRLAASCSNPLLRGEFVALPEAAPVTLGQPTALQVKFADECGNLLNLEKGSGSGVVVRFSNGDPDLRLVSIGGGVWSGTWRPLNATAAPVTLTAAAAYSRGLLVQAGITSRTVRISSQSPSAPVVRQGAMVHAASQLGEAPIAPGTLITLYGANLADSPNAVNASPLPTQVDGTEVLLAGQPLPLLFTSATQINAQVPFDLLPNTTHQLVVRRKGTLSVPESFAVSDAQPGIFTANQRGTGQGIVLGPDQTNLADPAHPVRPGDVVVIYCTGLGAVNQVIAPGSPAPTDPLAATTNPVAVTVGGKPANVLFAGLAPGFAGLYQVNAVLAADTPAGDAIPVRIEVNGQASIPVQITVR